MSNRIRGWLNDVVLIGTISQWAGFSWAGAIGVLVAVWAYVSNLPGPVIFVLGLLAAVAVLWIIRGLLGLPSAKRVSSTPEDVAARLKETTGATYQGITVLLDGNSFINCTFQDCNYQWDGGEYRFINCKIIGNRGIATTNRNIGLAFHLFALLMLDDEARKKFHILRI